MDKQNNDELSGIISEIESLQPTDTVNVRRDGWDVMLLEVADLKALTSNLSKWVAIETVDDLPQPMVQHWLTLHGPPEQYYVIRGYYDEGRWFTNMGGPTAYTILDPYWTVIAIQKITPQPEPYSPKEQPATPETGAANEKD